MTIKKRPQQAVNMAIVIQFDGLPMAHCFQTESDTYFYWYNPLKAWLAFYIHCVLCVLYVFETGISKKNLYRFVEGDTLLYIIFW